MSGRPVFAIATLVLAAVGAAPLEAAPRQSEVSPPDTADAEKFGCLHGAPPPACRTFWIVEMQASKGWQLEDQPRRDAFFYHDGGFTSYEWTAGHMVNLGDRWAVGGTVSVGNGSDDIFTGLRGRVRRWIRPQLSVELEAGLVESNGGGAWYPALTAASAGIRFNIQDYGSAFVRYDAFGTPENPRFAGPDEPAVPWERQAVVRGGVGLGGKAALVGTGVVAAGMLALFVLIAGAGGT